MNRRNFIKASAVTVGHIVSLSAAKKKKKNVLFIPIDDLKPLLKCYGESQIISPNIDKLAAKGTVFLNNHCQQAVCGPSRASLMTGLRPDTTQVFDLKTKMRKVNPDVITIPQHFKENGYETAGIGKVYDPRCVKKFDNPESWSIPYQTFYNISNPKYGNPQLGYLGEPAKKIKKLKQQAKKEGITKYGPQMKYVLEQDPTLKMAWQAIDVPDDAYNDGANTKKGIEIMKQAYDSGNPFFFAMGYSKPHLPFVAPKKYWDLYKPEDIKLAEYQEKAVDASEEGWHSPWEINGYHPVPKKGKYPEDLQRKLIHGYMACVSYVDAQIGLVLDALKELGIENDTIICLWGDHGWHLGDHGMWAKHTTYEQATRSPLIIVDPDIPGNKKSESPTEFIDIFPTLCELASLKTPDECEGVSLVPVMKDPSVMVKKAAISQWPAHGGMGYSIRTKRYRYTQWMKKDKKAPPSEGSFISEDLFDYKNDPLEKKSYTKTSEYSAVMKHMKALFDEIIIKENN
jgi:arylsulfatase A-like enzyme